MHKAICADCKKECSLPFKPSGDRPVYCQDCFSRRKVIKMSGITVADKPKEVSSLQAQIKTKKKAVAVKKFVGKRSRFLRKSEAFFDLVCIPGNNTYRELNIGGINVNGRQNQDYYHRAIRC